MLEGRPPTLFVRIDIVRGAVDAHLHPQVAGAASGAPSKPASLRSGGPLTALCWLLRAVPESGSIERGS